jgi:luciferase family oxidoreductase group 1
MSIQLNTPLSVLDIASVQRSVSPVTAIETTRALARRADELGYSRFWVAEHHSMANIASSSPAVLLAAIGADTRRIRIGSGGVMLPNHPPLLVAEEFGMLCALYGDRVDLGVGRAPGTFPTTVEALRRLPGDHFYEDLRDLVHFVNGTFPDDHQYRTVCAVPVTPTRPKVWLLGSSRQSAERAGERGLPYVFAHNFFGPKPTVDAVAAYRDSFRPSSTLTAPHVIVAVHVVCGENDEHAQWLADPAILPALSIAGVTRDQPFLSPQEAAAHAWTADERARADEMFADQAVGGPDKVRRNLLALLEKTAADELMVTNNVTDRTEKLASLQRVTELFDAPLPQVALV